MKILAPPLMRANGQYALFAFGHGRLWFGCALLVFSLGAAAQSQGSQDQLEAECICKFAEFTTWPENAFATSKSPLVIDILDDDALGRVLEKTVRGETVGGRHLVIERYQRAEEIKTCHILFISQTEIRQMDEIVKRLKGKPILTVTDAQGPAFAHVVIHFTIERNKLHFHINQQEAKAAHLTLSSRLLRLADTSAPTKNP